MPTAVRDPWRKLVECQLLKIITALTLLRGHGGCTCVPSLSHTVGRSSLTLTRFKGQNTEVQKDSTQLTGSPS